MIGNEYIILNSSDSDLLQEKVMEMLHLGYKLQGGISVTERNGSFYYFQAITKEKK